MEFTGERYLPDQEANDLELTVEHLHRYYSVLPLIKNKVVLDIACGEGYGAALMAKTANHVVGVDISQECISFATDKYLSHHSNIRCQKGSVESIPASDDTFDVIVSFETIEHVSEEVQKQFLSEVKRTLKKNGVFIVSTPDKENYSDRYQHANPFHVHELKRTEFLDLIAAYFSNSLLLEQGFDIVSSITPADPSALENLKVIKWREKGQLKNRKYLIAIASDMPIDENEINSVILDTDKDYLQQVDRIIELQKEVEERTAWALNLDSERVKNEIIINTLKDQQTENVEVLSEKIDTLQNWLTAQSQEKENHFNSLNTEITLQKNTIDAQALIINQQALAIASLQSRHDELENKLGEQLTDLQKLENDLNEQKDLIHQNDRLNAKVSKLTSELKQKEGILQDLQFNFSLTRQQLSDVNNKLVTIYDSDGWKALEKYYNFKGKYLHEESTHYRFIKNTLNFLRNRKNEFVAVPVPTKKFPQEQDIIHNTAVKKEIITRSLPVFETPTVSIIIPVYNAWEMNEKCIDSIIAHTTDVAYEIILADDCSTDETKDISKYFQNIVHIRNEKNLGFLLNCNNAASYARGKYLHFLNNDTEVKAGWLSSLVRLLENDPQAGMGGSKLIYPDGKLQEAGGIIWNDASGWNYGQGQNPEMPEFNYVKETDYISGASMMIRTSLWEEIGGFDERFSPAYCEDSDLAFTVREKGFKVLFQPLSEVVHYEGFSHGNDREQSEISSIKDYQVINNKKFYQKWKDVLQREQFPNAENVFWAKDRSQNKKTLLMVDHYVPQYDKDAGSRTTFQYLQLFITLGFNIKFLGENFYRHEPYTTVLQQMGIEVLYGPWHANNWKQWFKDNSEKFDYVYLNRPHISINFIDFFKENSRAKILYYGHDLHFLREQKRFELENNEALREEVEKWRKLELNLFSKSDVILTPSTEEQKVIKALNNSFNVQLMRPYIFNNVSDPVNSFETRSDLLFVGGFGHLPNVDGVLWFIKEIWPLVHHVFPDAKFIIAGSHPPNEITELAKDNVIVKGFVSDNELEELYRNCKIAVIPLRYGAGVKGKTVEAMRYGLPLVTTSFGVEGLPGDYHFIKAVDTNKAFANEIIELYNNEKALRIASEKGVNYIRENFSEEVAKKIILNALETI
jgi:GT2 family glycosyltransferase/SAM-dependent methyltransferase